MLKGRLIKGIGGFYYVDVGEDIYECRARGIFRKMGITPMVGDYVEMSVLDKNNKIGILENISERKTELVRPSVANVDQAVIVFAITQPQPNFILLDKFLILAEKQRLDLVICINKMDLLKDIKERDFIVESYQNSGYKILFTSYDDPTSIDKLREMLLGKVSVFAGPSGVGKSTLLNLIHPGLELKTGKVSSKTSRGKHTTRHVELIPIGKNSWVVDTPGFSSLNIDFIEENELSDLFPEFDSFLNKCMFSSCQHINEQECGVKDALKSGCISKQRYNSYLQFIEEIKRGRRF